MLLRSLLLMTLWLLAASGAVSTMPVKQGWQLVGIPSGLERMDVFDNGHVEIVWGFDAASQEWMGYAPEETLRYSIAAKGYGILESVAPYQAVWIFSTHAWILELPETDTPVAITNASLPLKTGWNLIALPQRTMVSPEIFGDSVVWKYDGSWALHASQKTDLNFPPIGSVSTAEGLWVRSSDDRVIDISVDTSNLRTFGDEAEMLAYIRKMLELNQYPYYGGFDTGVVAPTMDDAVSDLAAETEVSDATTTNLQEAGVDESDLLKHDGTLIYYVDDESHRIVVTSFTKIAAKDFAPLHIIPLDANQNIAAMYLQENRLILAYQTNLYEIPDGATEIKSKSTRVASFKIEVLDVSDIDAISTVVSHRLEGSFEQSRLIAGKLYAVSQFYPVVEYEYPKIYMSDNCQQFQEQLDQMSCDDYAYDATGMPTKTCGTAYDRVYQSYLDQQCYEYDYRDANGTAFKYDRINPAVVGETMIPSIISGESQTRPLVTPERFHAPYKLDQTASITTISSFDIADGSYDESISFLGNTHTYYAAPSSIYLVSSEYPLYYDFGHYKERQTVYKFGLGDTLTYHGRGSVDGRMLNRFSMSEYNDVLRVATTTGSTWLPSGTVNTVYTLQEHNRTLDVIDAFSGFGKAGEEIYAVRFMGQRGYVVTFRRTDPFYTLDLSDPKDIAVVGELEIPGFSEYFHPVDENRILSVGRDADDAGAAGGLQLQLFDISDFTNPQLADKVVIGDASTYSEAEYNPQAFIYRNSDNMFGLPYRSYSIGYSENYGIYRVNDWKIDTLRTFSVTNSYWSYGRSRGVIFDYNGSTYGALFKGEHILCETIE